MESKTFLSGAPLGGGECVLEHQRAFRVGKGRTCSTPTALGRQKDRHATIHRVVLATVRVPSDNLAASPDGSASNLAASLYIRLLVGASHVFNGQKALLYSA